MSSAAPGRPLANAASVARPVRLLLADEAPMLRAGYRGVLGGMPGLDVVGEASDGIEAVDLARRLLPDVLLLDPGLPRQDGEATTRAIVAAGLPVRVLVLGWTADERAVAALRAGAVGLLTKDTPAAELAAAIFAVAAGQAVLAPATLTRLLTTSGFEPAPAAILEAETAELDSLTDREREVLVLVARGLSNAEIAARLGVSATTVKTHLGRLLSKLGARDRVGVVVLAYEAGLVRPGELTAGRGQVGPGKP